MTLMGPVVAIHDQLVSTGDELEVVSVVELLGDILTEGVSGTTG